MDSKKAYCLIPLKIVLIPQFFKQLFIGNHLASGLKRIHDDSASVFPESVYTSVDSENNRWRSLYNSEFIPLGWVDKRGLISPGGQSTGNSRPMAATKRGHGNITISADSMVSCSLSSCIIFIKYYTPL